MLSHYIYSKTNSIPRELCNDIIQLFEEASDKCDGVTGGGMNKNVKDTMDYVISNDPKWTKINKLLIAEIEKHSRLYISYLVKINAFAGFNASKCENCYSGELLTRLTPFQIQRYEQNKGKYVYHTDFKKDNIICNVNCKRVITFLWYLNDVEIGGETELMEHIKIKPVAGKLILFPADLAFVHCGNMPISSNKYIITGWLHFAY